MFLKYVLIYSICDFNVIVLGLYKDYELFNCLLFPPDTYI